MVCKVKIYGPKPHVESIGHVEEPKDKSIPPNYLPNMYFTANFQGCGTEQWVQQIMLANSLRSFRPFRITVLEELCQITSKEGKDFVNAWLNTVACHAFLWKNGIEYGDPSLWDIMYHPKHKCGILINFDIATIVWKDPCIPRIDCMGAIPFMALELLRDEFRSGSITCYFHHELEAFMWILPFVFLAYRDCKHIEDTMYIQDWMMSDHNTCYKEKLAFLRAKFLDRIQAPAPFKGSRKFLSDICKVIHQQESAHVNRKETLFHAAMEQDPDIEESTFELSYSRIRNYIGPDKVEKLQSLKPLFDRTLTEELFQEMQELQNTLFGQV